MHRLLRLAPALTFVLLVAALPALRGQTLPSAATVLENVRREFDRVKDYSADLQAVVDMPGVKVPPMAAKIWFKQPDRVHFEAKGFAMLPRDAMSMNPRMFSEDLYDAVVQGEETVDGARCLKVKLLAKSDTLRLQRAMLFVDPTRWLIVRMNTDPNQGGSAEITITYSFLENKYFLPSKVVLRMQAMGGIRIGPKAKNPGKDDTAEKKKPATIVMTYTNYRVNKGVSDEIFTRGKEDRP